MEKKDHIQTLESENSLLHLYVAALTHDGSYLVHTNYDEEEKVSYIIVFAYLSRHVSYVTPLLPQKVLHVR